MELGEVLEAADVHALGYAAQVVAHQVDDRMVLAALFVVRSELLSCIGDVGIDGTLHWVRGEFVPLELHEAFGREGHKAPREEDAIGCLGGEIDVLEARLGLDGRANREIREEAISPHQPSVDDLEALGIVLEGFGRRGEHELSLRADGVGCLRCGEVEEK